MAESFPNNPAEASAADPHSLMDEDQPLAWYDSTIRDCAETAGFAGPGIILAGIAYPLVLFTGLFLLTLPSSSEVLPILLMCVLASLSVCPIAALVGLMLATVIIPAVNAAFGFVWNARTLVSIVGGLAGFLPFGWLYYIIAPSVNLGDVLFVSLFAGLAVLMGQVGAVWSCIRQQRSGSLPRKCNPGTRPTWQFSLVRIFSTTAVIAAVLAIDRVLEFRFSIAFGTYIVLQLLGLGIDWIYVHAIGARMAKKHGSLFPQDI